MKVTHQIYLFVGNILANGVIHAHIPINRRVTIGDDENTNHNHPYIGWMIFVATSGADLEYYYIVISYFYMLCIVKPWNMFLILIDLFYDFCYFCLLTLP